MKTLNTFTRFFVMAFAIALLSTSLWAQPGQRDGRGPKLPDSEQIVKMVDELGTTLSLTEAQKTKVSDLYFAHFEEVKELMQDKPSREKMDEVKKDFEEQVMSVLDDDQKVKYAEMMKQRGPGQQRPRR